MVDTPEFTDVLNEAAIDCPVVFETHASYLPALRHYYSRVSDSVFGSDRAVRIQPQRLLSAGCPPEKIYVIPNGIDPDVFAEQKEAGCSWSCKQRPLAMIFSVGRLEPQKNTLEFIQVACALLDEGQAAHFVVVGDAVDTADYAAKGARSGAPAYRHHFRFLPRVEYGGMRRLFMDAARSGGCLVITSLNESQPMTILEAMASDAP